jgi:hypothetical protein
MQEIILQKRNVGNESFLQQTGCIQQRKNLCDYRKEKEKANDFFESGVVSADLILKDYIKIFILNFYRIISLLI